MLVRVHIGRESTERADGYEEGGPFVMQEVADMPAKLKRRMARCAGCHDDFYNGRQNFSCNHCWSLDKDQNFAGRGRPTCYH